MLTVAYGISCFPSQTRVLSSESPAERERVRLSIVIPSEDLDE